MQKILKYVYLTFQTPHRHIKPEGFVYFQIFGKTYKWNYKKQICLCFMFKFAASVCFFSLYFFVKSFGQDFKLICNNLCGRFNVSTEFFVCLLLKALPELGRVHAPFYIMNLTLSSLKILPDGTYLVALQGVH